MFCMCCLSKEKSSLKTSIKSICGKVCHCGQLVSIHHKKKEKKNIRRVTKLSDFTIQTIKSLCRFHFPCNVLGYIYKINGLKLGFYYKSSNTFLNVVSKWSKNYLWLSRTEEIMLWKEVKDFHLIWNRANIVSLLFIKQWFKFGFIFNFPLCHCKESDQTEDKLALYTQRSLSDTPLVFSTSHSFNPPLRTILEGR